MIHTSMCSHDVADPANTLIAEWHWSGLNRVRCVVCGGTAEVTKSGAIKPEPCKCHSFRHQTDEVAS